MANKYGRVRGEAGGNWAGGWRTGWKSGVFERVEAEGEEWGCRALFIRAATLGPQALLDPSQNHTAANTED